MITLRCMNIPYDLTRDSLFEARRSFYKLTGFEANWLLLDKKAEINISQFVRCEYGGLECPPPPATFREAMQQGHTIFGFERVVVDNPVAALAYVGEEPAGDKSMADLRQSIAESGQ